MLREFPVENIPSRDGFTRIFASAIQCAKCEKIEHYQKRKEAGKQVVETHFRKGGWRIGNGPRHDICPACQSVERQPKPKEKPALRVVENNPAPASPKTLVATAAPPREMNREDNKLVFDKIDQFYLNEKEGYATPWNDVAIAKDLGCPVAWVVKIRDQFFGPAGSNAEIDKFQGEVTKLSGEMILINDRIAAHNRAGAELTKDVGSITSRIRELENAAAKILRAVGKS